MAFALRASGAVLVALLPLAAPRLVAAADPPTPPVSSSSAATSTAASSSSAPVDSAKERRHRQARAVELHDEAKALYDRGLYRRAIAKLEAALELDPEGKELVYNLAVIHEKLVEPDVAAKYYVRYIDMETDPRARDRAEAIVKRLESAKKNLEADLKERAGTGAASASAPPSGTAVVAAAQVHHAPSPMVFVLGGVAIAAAAVGVGFGASALATHPDGVTTGPGTTSYDLDTRAQSAHTQAVVADLALVTSFVVGAATAVLYLLESRASRPAPPSPPKSAGLRVEVLF